MTLFIYYYFFFLISNKTGNSLTKRREYNKAKRQAQTEKQQQLHFFFLYDLCHHWRTNSLPNIRFFLPPSILCKYMCCLVVFSFHMLDIPTAKRGQKTKNAMIYMAKLATGISCCDIRNNIQSIGFQNNMRKL